MACTMEYESGFTVQRTFLELESSSDWSDLPVGRQRADTDTCIDYSFTEDLSLKGKAGDGISTRTTTVGAESRASDGASSWWADEDDSVVESVDLDDVASVDLDDLASLASEEYYADPQLPLFPQLGQLPLPEAAAPSAPPGFHLARQSMPVQAPVPMRQAPVPMQQVPAPMRQAPVSMQQQVPVPMKTVYVAMMMPVVSPPQQAATQKRQPQPQPQAASAAKVVASQVRTQPEPAARKPQDRAMEKKKQPELAKAAEKKSKEAKAPPKESKNSRKKGAKGPQRPAGSTTIVIRQLPTSLVRGTFQQMLDLSGFQGLYDFLYLPMDFGSSKNFGYGLVNFTSTAHAEAAVARFDGIAIGEATVCAEWSKTHSSLASLVQRYQTSPVMAADVPDACKPLLLYNGRPILFPAPAV